MTSGRPRGGTGWPCWSWWATTRHAGVGSTMSWRPAGTKSTWRPRAGGYGSASDTDSDEKEPGVVHPHLGRATLWSWLRGGIGTSARRWGLDGVAGAAAFTLQG